MKETPDCGRFDDAGVRETSRDEFSTPEGLHKSALFRKHRCLLGNVTASSGTRRFSKQEQRDAA
jgi:hypothetical protein